MIKFDIDLEYNRLKEESEKKRAEEQKRYNEYIESQKKIQAENQKRINDLWEKAGRRMEEEERAEKQAAIDKAKAEAEKNARDSYKKSHPYDCDENLKDDFQAWAKNIFNS